MVFRPVRARERALPGGVPPGVKCPENFGLALRVPIATERSEKACVAHLFHVRA